MVFMRGAAASLLSSNVSRACLRTQAIRPAAHRITGLQQAQHKVLRPAFLPVRWHSVPSGGSRAYDFDAMKQYVESPSPDRIIIDVREPAEYEEGFIPGAINIPIKSQPDAMFLPEDEFEDRFGFSKPEMGKEVVFYCKSGVRSSAAAQLAQQHGYKNVSEYRGSWMDWRKQGGKEERPGMSTDSTSGSGR
ncbi:hypothetical protein KC367_g6459 [Hortaea werneckii]|nr:hypothetical protein KC350_g17236 [Hortaea werneckii]OTA24896.1 hypothetical protein BTJ68_10991 [Hortaea werneckii EXF-2000]KAI6799955.1 hypothetical protein KC358_g15806 [Hortaea werneckii]KAI6901265.1 hypothetical protein KC348_g16523 [Hortaea werneckii]KAI6920745.1 hypothetical protein KC341_g16400 [Hortaea werneckii]